MHCTRKVTDSISWIGGSDRRLALFENMFPIPNGVSYNCYLLQDEKNVLLDTVDASVSRQALEDIEYLLDGKSLDYLVVNHMEPDHGALIETLFTRYPEMKLVGNAKTTPMLKQFFNFDISDRMITVAEGETLNTGAHTLHFVMAPMVHWPEAMVTYDETDKVLFSADAFGTFGALSGNIFNDELDFERDWLDDARRYYSNIVGKFGAQVQALLKKAAALDIQTICPLHGPIWRSDLGFFLDKYDKWSKYEPEDKAVLIVYASMYGNTENAASALASRLADQGVKDIAMYDVSNTHYSYLISEMFRCSHIVFAAPTYNGGVYPPMETLLTDMKALNVQNRTAAVLENGTWAPTAGRKITETLEQLKNFTIIDTPLTVKSALKNDREEIVAALAEKIAESVK